MTSAEPIKITPPRIGRAVFHIEGTAPLMTARFSKKAEIMAGMEAGSTSRSKRNRPARDFNADAKGATYVAIDGWYGMNASAFRKAAISACRLVNFKMTLAKLSIFIEADGYDREEGMPLVRILADEPAVSVMPVRNATGVIDMRARPLWGPGWKAAVRIAWDLDQFTITDISNLLTRVGAQVGIGEGRPDSRDSAGLGYGLFNVTAVEQGA
jgi:hypothetical protein